MRAVQQCRQPVAPQRRGVARPQRAVLTVPRAQQQGSGQAPAEAAVAAAAPAAAAAEQQHAVALAEVAAQALDAEQQQQQDEVVVAASETATQAPSERQAAQHVVAAPEPPAGPGGLPIGSLLSHPGVRIAGADQLHGYRGCQMCRLFSVHACLPAQVCCNVRRAGSPCRSPRCCLACCN